MSGLDSRNIEWAFGQQITKPGTLTIALSYYGLSSGDTYSVNVANDKRASKTWNVPVRLEANHLVAINTPAEISTGDVILWFADGDHKVRFAVAGASTSGEAFDSRSIKHNAVYIHRFGSPEEVEWIDAVGKTLAGKISVQAPRMSGSDAFEQYQAALAQPQIIAIDGARAQPLAATVLVGQVVFFSVQNSIGIAIADKAIVGAFDRANR
jgi:hypothetical protein